MALTTKSTKDGLPGLVEIKSTGSLSDDDKTKCRLIINMLFRLLNDEKVFRPALTATMTKDELPKLDGVLNKIDYYMNEINEGRNAGKTMYLPDPAYFEQKAANCEMHKSSIEDYYKATKNLNTEFSAAMQDTLDLNSQRKTLNQIIKSNRFIR